ncbi:uncharacterized protein LOC144327333 isoform X4 [Podarcis muralis]
MQIPAKEHQPTRLVSCCCVLNSAQLFLRTINSLGEGKKKSTREEVPEGELGYSAAAETAENGNMECIWNTNSMDALQLSWLRLKQTQKFIAPLQKLLCSIPKTDFVGTP